MSSSPELKVSLYRKISNVMRDVQYLSKDSYVSFGKTNYRAITEEKVTTAIRESLIKNGLVIIPVGQKYQRNGNIASMEIEYKIIDIDTGESEIIVSAGEGADSQDKAAGKAMTYAYKYLLLRTFAIPTGEDPDRISSDEIDARNKAAASSPEVVISEIGRRIESLVSIGYNVDDIRNATYGAVGQYNSFQELNPNQLSSILQLLDTELSARS